VGINKRGYEIKKRYRIGGLMLLASFVLAGCGNGTLYDKWWKVNAAPEPSTDFNPIWASQSTNTRNRGDS